MLITDIADEMFKIGNSSFGVQLYACGIVCCILAIFCRLRGRKNA